MKMIAYDYATLGFRPYPETQEFVTIGVVVLNAKAPEFGYSLLALRKTGRITAMFPAIPKELYASAWQALQQELEAIKEAVNMGSPFEPRTHRYIHHADGQGLFNAITTPREGLISYQTKGRRLAKDLPSAIEALHHRFIDQKTLDMPPSVEVGMVRSLVQMFKKAGIVQDYERDVKIGPEQFQVSFALARMSGPQRAQRALRPLNFDRATTTEIFNHGDEWIQKLRRLKKIGYRPDHCLFTVRSPQSEEGIGAYLQIKAEFAEMEVQLADEKDENTILNFADPSQPRLF